MSQSPQSEAACMFEWMQQFLNLKSDLNKVINFIGDIMDERYFGSLA